MYSYAVHGIKNTIDLCVRTGVPKVIEDSEFAETVDDITDVDD